MGSRRRLCTLDEVNRLRTLAVLAPITADANHVVTDARPGFSYHNYGLAADLCYATGDPYRERDHALTWEQIGALAEAQGLVWGGRFRMRPDRPHVQWTGTLGLADLRAGTLPPIETG
jgi:peptidoglycan LD-endopeptidase CwlK